MEKQSIRPLLIKSIKTIQININKKAMTLLIRINNRCSGLLAPRTGNEVAYVTQIIDDVHFAWQAQYLVRLEGDFTCSTH